MSTANATKSLKQLEADAKEKLRELDALKNKGEDRTLEDLERQELLSSECEAIEEVMVKSHKVDNLKAGNRLANTLAVVTTPDRPYLGGAAGDDGAALTLSGDGSIKSLGRQLAEHNGFRAWLKSQFPGDHIPDGAKFQSPAFALKSVITLAGDISASRPLAGLPERRPELVPLGWTPLVLSDLITTVPTNSDLIETAREKSRTNNADVVGEATDDSGSSGVKPQSILDWELTTVTVKTIAHWIATSTRALQDLRRLQQEVDKFLRMGIDQRKEDLILNGNPATDSNQFTGIYNTTGILTQAYVTSILATCRKARTKLKVDGKAMPSAYVMHPTDWEAIDLLQDGEQRYYFGGPLSMGNPRLWGVPVIESEYATVGLAILGAFVDAVLYDREQTTVQTFNQHSDFAVRNLVAILAEMRAAFHVRRPKSFVTVDLVA